jgi:hypothetical protein
MTATHESATGAETAGRFFIIHNVHTNHYDVVISKQELFEMMETETRPQPHVVVDRYVTVCSHTSKHWAEECVQGVSCAYGTPVGKLT